MSSDVDEKPAAGTAAPNTADLLRGIVGDVRHLIDQQLHLTRLEIKAGIKQLAAAGWVLGLALVAVLFSALLGCLALTHLLHWMTSPVNADPASLPLWACHAVVATVLLIAGAVLFQMGRIRLKAIEPCQISRPEKLWEQLPWGTTPN